MQGIIDIHCHILPGIDDGAQTVREAREMLKMQYRDGVRKIILTPHYRPGMFEPSVSQIYRTYYRLQEEAKETNIQLFLGREYHTGHTGAIIRCHEGHHRTITVTMLLEEEQKRRQLCQKSHLLIL